VRILAQLIDAISGRHIWAERYDRDFMDIFAPQEDITKNVVTALEARLTAGEWARTQRKQTENYEAYGLFVRARALRRDDALSKSVNVDARELYRKAVALDPNISSAWNGLAVTHWLDARFGWTKNSDQSLSQSVDAVSKVLAIDDTLPVAYLHLANIAFVKRQYDQAIVHCEKALSLDPPPVVMAHCGRMWTQVGRSEEALELITKAMRRNPYFESIYFFVLGNAHRMLGNYDKAIAAMEARRDMEPKTLTPLFMLAATYAEAGQMDKARAMVKDSVKRFPKY
jgi:adenylate cyclase